MERPNVTAWKEFSQSIRILLSGFLVFALVAPDLALAAERYWRGDADDRGSQWDSTGNWAATVGGATGSSVPGVDDTVNLDSSIAIQRGTGQQIKIKNTVRIEKLVISPTFTGKLLIGSSSLLVGSGGIRMGSGVINIGTGTNLSISGSFIQTGGILSNSLANNIFALSGDLITLRKARFNYSGTIVFEGWRDQTFAYSGSNLKGKSLPTQAVGGASFSGITLNNTGGSTNDDLHVSGRTLIARRLTVTLGTVEMNGNSSDTAGRSSVALALSGTLTIADAAAAIFQTDANVTLSGALSTGAAGKITMSAGTLTFNGISQNLDMAGTDSKLHTVIIKSNSGVYLQATTLVTASLTITGSSVLTHGANTLYATGATFVNYGTLRENTGKLVHTGSFFYIADSSYNPINEVKTGDTMYFTLTDSDENTIGTTAQTLTITVSISGGDSETVTLTETRVDSGVFRGSIATKNASATSEDATLQTTADKTVTATYTDGEDSKSNTDTVLFTPVGSSTTSTNSGGGSSRSRAASGGGGGGGGTVTTPAAKPAVRKSVKKKKKKAVRRRVRRSARERAQERRAARMARRAGR